MRTPPVSDLKVRKARNRYAMLKGVVVVVHSEWRVAGRRAGGVAG